VARGKPFEAQGKQEFCYNRRHEKTYIASIAPIASGGGAAARIGVGQLAISESRAAHN
jgi:hypothetical protein